MSLTMGQGPLAEQPGALNFELRAPEHRMFFGDYPRRMRAVVGDRVVLDSTSGRLLHETGSLPVLYVPLDDVDQTVLERSSTAVECPFRGVASYWSVDLDGHRLDDAVWGYEDPKPGHEWLHGYVALDFDAPDAWFCEDQRVFGHLRDPYHRVDVFESSRPVTVTAGDLLIARSDRPKLLFETGLPTRYYLPATDVEPGLLEPSPTRRICPYKGQSWYWTLSADGESVADAAWSYETPLPEAIAIQGHLCFDLAEGIDVDVGDPPDRHRSL